MTVRVPVGVRLLLTIGAIAASLAAPAFYAVYQLDDVRNIASELGGRQADAGRALAALQATRIDVERLQRVYVAAPSPALEAQLAGCIGSAGAQLERLRRVAPGLDLAPLAASLDSIAAAATSLQQLVRAGRLEDATARLETIEPRYAALDAALAASADRLDRSRERRVNRAWVVSDSATRTVVVALTAGSVLAILLTFWLTNALALPLRRLQSATARVASGRFDADDDVASGRNDELGDLARSFRTMTERLAELDRVKAEFVGVASYEIKGPIGLIGGYVELLEEALQDDPEAAARCARLVEPIREQTETLRQLAHDLLELSHVSAGGLQLEREDIRTDTFAVSIAKSYRSLARRSQIDFNVVVDASAPRSFDADPDCLASDVIGTLIGKALHSTPAGGRIDVRFRGADDALLVEIADSGPGIPEEHLPFIFEKYYHAGQRLQRIGSGLGLAIAREIVELHGGTIGVSSEPGRGTTFRVLLPLQPSRAPGDAMALPSGVIDVGAPPMPVLTR